MTGMALPIKLNIGGVLYTTTRSTLITYPDSMLGAMFSGSMPTTLDNDGNYFIDRNGSMFTYVLDFLRSSKLTLPEDFKQFDQLAVEADFYQIQPLIKALNDWELKRQEKLQLASRSPPVTMLKVKQPFNTAQPISFTSRLNVLKVLALKFHIDIEFQLDHWQYFEDEEFMLVNGDYCHDPQVFSIELESGQNVNYCSTIWYEVVDYLQSEGGQLLQGHTVQAPEYVEQTWLMPDTFTGKT